jgi:RNA polymerase sigma-70 factor (ECF subfamily)
VLRWVRPDAARELVPDARQLVEWARRAAVADRQSARQLLVAVGPAMLRTIRKVLGPDGRDAEDVLQEAFQGLLGALPSFKQECTVLHFACRVAVFTALAWRRTLAFRSRQMVDDPDAADASASADPSPAESVLRARRREALETLLDDLPPPQAEVLVLHCALDFTIDEIAAAVGRPAETIRSRLRHAKRAVRERVGASAELAEILGSGL